ncbi:MAG: DNA methyltransferase [Candidatus Heimdallarchaeota archaeon]
MVFDPFMGSGTTALVAKKHNRHYLGCEISPEYLEISKKRLAIMK